MSEETLKKLEHLFLAMSDRTRLRLFALMADGEVSVGFLADELDESQPKISRHLAYLRGTGLVTTRRDGKRIYYGIENQSDGAVALVLGTLLDALSDRRTEKGEIRSGAIGRTGKASRLDANTPEEQNISDWTPNELEIFLL